MKRIKMGCTTLSIPAMALGIMRMNQKSVPEAQVAIQAAYDAGINFIDSADIYGGGKSEEIFGQAFSQMQIKQPCKHVAAYALFQENVMIFLKNIFCIVLMKFWKECN